MFKRISFLKAKNVGIEETADGTGRRSSLIGRAIRKLGAQMFTQIFTPMTWHNSSGSCTRGAATCTTWLLDVHAARIVYFDRKSVSHQFTRQQQKLFEQYSQSCSWDNLEAVRGTGKGVPHACCSHNTAQTACIRPTFHIYPTYATAMIGTVYIY